MNPGIAYALLAFTLWGLFPLYFLRIASVASLEVVLQRSAWSLVFVLVVLAWQRRFGWLAGVWREPRLALRSLFCALLLMGNWFVYVLAVQRGQVVEASLGFFINPLVSVMLGVLVLGERPRRVQWAAVALAAAGVLWLGWQGARLPWIALVLAFSFALYGLLRKTATLGALEGLALESMLVAPLVLPWLAWWTFAGDGALGMAWGRSDFALIGWLMLAGPLTAGPLWLFAAAARRMPLATIGLLQYLSPTLQLLLGVWVFGEPFGTDRALGFALIWLGLALYSAEAWWRLTRAAAPPPAPAPPR